MNFSEKLDLLMTLTGTSNSALGRALSYDPSYISRVRAGKRGLPRRQPFLEPAAEFLARAIQTPAQQQAAAGLLALNRPWPRDPGQGAASLAQWLQARSEDMTEPIDQFFRRFTEFTPGEITGGAIESPPPIEDPAFFYGNPGKREAVIRFLTDLCADGEAHTLYLVSDEAMDWLHEDRIFEGQWAALLTRFLANGGMITIIHTIDRNLGEMLEALREWIPLYLTGRILPYYCPRLRDGICRRSLFVAPGRAALTANSIEGQTNGMLNLYTRDPQAVAACEEEFTRYLALCRPLMEIYSAERSADLIAQMCRVISGPGPLVSAGPFPLPAASLCSSAERPLHQALADRLAEGGQITELLHLPDPRAVHTGTLPLPLGDLFGTQDPACYPAFFQTRVSAALTRLKTVPGYRAVFTDRIPATVSVLARNREVVMVFPSAPPTTVFVLTESRMVSALWDYLDRAAGPADQSAAVRKLEGWLNALDALTGKQGKS